jgi:hypothetical protein
MPQPVAELVEATRVVGGAQPIVLVEIRDVGNFGTQQVLGRAASAARRLDLAEREAKAS